MRYRVRFKARAIQDGPSTVRPGERKWLAGDMVTGQCELTSNETDDMLTEEIIQQIAHAPRGKYGGFHEITILKITEIASLCFVAGTYRAN